MLLSSVMWTLSKLIAECFQICTPRTLPLTSCVIWDSLQKDWWTHNPYFAKTNRGALVDKYPDSKVHGANMMPIWSRQDPGGPHVGPTNFGILVTIRSGYILSHATTTLKDWGLNGSPNINYGLMYHTISVMSSYSFGGVTMKDIYLTNILYKVDSGSIAHENWAKQLVFPLRHSC